jgi:UDP-glucose 4-epimerase
MEILITGGAGFIGSHLAETFVSEGHDVVVFDNLDPYYDVSLKQRNLDQIRDAAAQSDGTFEAVKGNVRDESAVSAHVTPADCIFHQAAQAGVRTSVENPRKPHKVNVDGTLNVLDAARDSDTKRVILASSSSVYGKAENLPYEENDPARPVSPYGVSKLAAEQYARVYSEVYDLPTVSLRYFTVYGPRMRPNMAISNFVSRCLDGRPPVVYGDGKQTRDFTHISDIVDANRRLLSTDAADGEVLNIGSTDNITIRQLAINIRDQIDPNLELQYDDRHAGDAEHTHADISKAKEYIGYEPSISIEEGVERFVGWYRDNPQWYEPIPSTH